MATRRFAKLPPELHLHIYGYALSFEPPLKHAGKAPDKRQHAVTLLLCASRRCHNKAADLFYAQNTFAFNLYDSCPHHQANAACSERLFAHEYSFIKLVVSTRAAGDCDLDCLFAVLSILEKEESEQKLKSMTVEILSWTNRLAAAWLYHSLRDSGKQPHCTGVGSFEIIDDTPGLRFEYPDIIKIWNYSAIPPTDAPEWSTLESLPDEVKGAMSGALKVIAPDLFSTDMVLLHLTLFSSAGSMKGGAAAQSGDVVRVELK